MKYYKASSIKRGFETTAIVYLEKLVNKEQHEQVHSQKAEK